VTVEKEVRCKVVPASSTMEIKRDQSMLSEMESNMLFYMIFTLKNYLFPLSALKRLLILCYFQHQVPILEGF
jgi:hypothetical protein